MQRVHATASGLLARMFHERGSARGACLAALLFLAAPAWALGPHEVLLLINAQSADSIEVGKTYAELRQIPDRNVVRLDIPEEAITNGLSPAQFTQWIWLPATRALHAQGLDLQVLAWIYSVDFPVRITTTPAISLMGITFLRNRLPDAKVVEAGRYESPLFAGILDSRNAPGLAQTFDTAAEGLREDMPLPSMMLGYTRPPNGNSIAEVLDCLRRGVAADSTFPTGLVYFVQTDDVRSRCREWQQGTALRDMAAYGVRAVITNAEPAHMRGVLGMQIGAALVHPKRNTYVPGSVADHLTSAGAVLNNDFQTKLTAWIGAGVTATAGTVTEPYAIWTKFPSAHFFYFYGSGCTIMESFYQSIRCPLQLLLLGEPLASPWKPRDRLVVAGLEESVLAKPAEVRPSVDSKSGVDYRTFRYYLDDRRPQTGKTLVLAPAQLAPGVHRLRVVAYRTGMVREQVFEEHTFTVPGVPKQSVP